jgi:hypothetical protein
VADPEEPKIGARVDAEEKARVLETLRNDPLCKGPMPPDHPMALKPGETIVIFMKKRRPAPESKSGARDR